MELFSIFTGWFAAKSQPLFAMLGFGSSSAAIQGAVLFGAALLAIAAVIAIGYVGKLAYQKWTASSLDEPEDQSKVKKGTQPKSKLRKASEPEVLEPEVLELEVPEPEVPEPEVPEPEVPEPEVPEPEVLELEVPEPKVLEPKVLEPEVPELEVPEPKVPEPKVPEPKVPEPKVPEPKVLEPKVLELKVLEPKVLEPKVLEPKVLEPKFRLGQKVLEPKFRLGQKVDTTNNPDLQKFIKLCEAEGLFFSKIPKLCVNLNKPMSDFGYTEISLEDFIESRVVWGLDGKNNFFVSYLRDAYKKDVAIIYQHQFVKYSAFGSPSYSAFGSPSVAIEWRKQCSGIPEEYGAFDRSIDFPDVEDDSVYSLKDEVKILKMFLPLKYCPVKKSLRK